MPATRVWLVRHAETAVPTVFHGAESDVGLSPLGERQAAAAADWFRQLSPTVVVSSGMLRAVRTAKPIADRCDVPLLIESSFHERRVGSLGGTAFSPTEGPWAETMRRWASGETSYTTPGAESFDELRYRVLPAFDRVTAAHAGGRIVLAAHGVVCKVLLLSLLDGWGPRRWADLGRGWNLSVSELVGCPGFGWRAERLLVVPPPVEALAQTTPITGKSEA